ncbi:hypothetical protein BGY98DRAFT_1098941 [Russula aff. rugulosa BPL654]|nr:hypothetical protein BGY98DRAFT_1098941 [Russula aff. rugulosa BPL654]
MRNIGEVELDKHHNALNTSDLPSPAPAQAQGVCHEQGLLTYWPPAVKGSIPLRRLKVIVAEASRQAPALAIEKLHDATAREEAIAEWRERWTTQLLRPQPAHLALTNPPDGSLPPFTNGISNYPLPIVTTVSTPPVSTITRLAAIAEKPSTQHIMSSRLACYTPNPGSNFSYQFQTNCLNHLLHEGDSVLGHFLATS